MSCEINTTANIVDVAEIRRCLFPSDDHRGSDSWLQLCEISVCPTGDLIVVANERRLVVLTAKWDTSSSQSQFQISFSGSVHDSDNIRAVACLPVVNQTKSSHIVCDWICILLGFESGCTRFYTENCELLLEEQVHNEGISSIKCRSQHSPRPELSPRLHPEEIYVQFQSTVCVLSGKELFPVLRQLRAELARVQAKGETLEKFTGHLTPKKWGFQDQATINDVAVVGVNLHQTFDHLLTASTCGGFETRYRYSAPYNKLVLAAGSRPFVGYHYALEGPPMPVLSDVAKAVAIKLKSALPTWLTGTKPAQDKPSVALQPAEDIGFRFGLCDLRRTATDIVLSPDHKLAAISDTLGRVLLIDAFRGIALRIFKGYREAQCSFVQVPDQRHSKHRIGNKVAMFLVIYSPKKGTIEIFTVKQGRKVSTFSASKFSRLIYNNYGLMGFTTRTDSRYVCQFNTVLIDNDGLIKEITIPFYFALSEENNKRARDLYLFKKLKQALRQSDLEFDILKTCTELTTVEIKTQTLELLLGEKNLQAEVLLNCVQYFLDADHDSLRTLSQNVCFLLNFYQFAKNQTEDCVKNQEGTLELDPIQRNHLQTLLDLCTTNQEKKVSFTEGEISPSEFLSVFHLNQIHLKQDLDAQTLFKVSQLIFEKSIQHCKLSNFEEELSKTKIPNKDLFVLLIHYWVHRPLDNSNWEKEMNNLFQLISSLAQDNTIWEEIREILATSSKPFSALTAAILCKMVSESMETNDDDSIEILTEESVEWSLLIGKLEDVSLLNIVLSNKPEAKKSTLPKLKHDHIDISLKYILEKGRGSVSELVARWLTICGVDPENLVINDVLLKPEEPETSSDDDDDALPKQEIMPHIVKEVKSEPVLQQLNILKPQFPYSLEAGVVLCNMCWEYALAWQKNIQDLGNLEAAIKCLTHIPSSHLREGLFLLVWNTHLKIIFESASKLVSKVGKLPKERLCKQDTGLTDYQLAVFLGITTNFLDSYTRAVRESCGIDKPVLSFEAIWEHGPQPLTGLALQQNPINYDLLLLHYQLSLTLHMLTAFSVKHSKPLSTLFESYMLSLFFIDFQTKTRINWDYVDSRVNQWRIHFLRKVIAASVESVTVSEGNVYAADHRRWMEKCLDIAELWNLDLDDLRRFELVQIYINGYDSWGDEKFTCVAGKNKLGLDLLEIAGRRLKHFLDTSPYYVQNVTALTTDVTRYIKPLDGDCCAPSDLDGIENLANRSLHCIAEEENPSEYRIADLLLDGCRTLQSIYRRSS